MLKPDGLQWARWLAATICLAAEEARRVCLRLEPPSCTGGLLQFTQRGCGFRDRWWMMMGHHHYPNVSCVAPLGPVMRSYMIALVVPVDFLCRLVELCKRPRCFQIDEKGKIIWRQKARS